MLRTTGLILIAGLTLAACGRNGEEAGSGAGAAEEAVAIETPEQFIGVWAADCERPYVRFAEHEVQVYNDGQTYPITSVTYDGQSLVVGYETGNGSIQETYVASGETLQLTSGVYDGVDIPATQPAMERCD